MSSSDVIVGYIEHGHREYIRIDITANDFFAPFILYLLAQTAPLVRTSASRDSGHTEPLYSRLESHGDSVFV